MDRFPEGQVKALSASYWDKLVLRVSPHRSVGRDSKSRSNLLNPKGFSYMHYSLSVNPSSSPIYIVHMRHSNRNAKRKRPAGTWYNLLKTTEGLVTGGVENSFRKKETCPCASKYLSTTREPCPYRGYFHCIYSPMYPEHSSL